MALELFQAPIYGKKLESRGLATTIQGRQKMVEREAVVWDIPGRSDPEHPVLLNRAPTLHRLGIRRLNRP